MGLEIIDSYLTGEPIRDAIVIGVLFTIFFEFYKVCFSTIFSIFKK